MRLRVPSFRSKNPSQSKPLPIRDPDSLESGPDGSEVEGIDTPPIKIGKAKREEIAKLVEERFKLSQTARMHQEGAWAVALAYYAGRAWIDWDPEKGLQDVRDQNDKRWYRSVPLIRPLCQIATARITSNRPDVQILPRSKDSEQDVAAADELRLVVEHFNTVYHFRLLLQRLATYTWMATTAFLLQYWDPSAEAEIAVEWDAQNNPTRYEMRPVGNYKERMIPGDRVYGDPRSQNWDEGEWLIYVDRMSNEDVEQKWGKPAEHGDKSGTVFNSLFDSFVMPWGRPGAYSLRQQLVKTLYERPSLRYPKGRTMVVSGSDVLEYKESLPCGFIPLLPVGARQSIGSPYHAGFGLDLIQCQYDINLLRSRALGGLRDQKITVVRVKGDGSGADLDDALKGESDGIDETPRIRTIWYKRGGTPPTFTIPPVVDLNSIREMISDIRAEMAEIAGVHKVSSGAGDPNATSGISMRLLKDSDESSGAEFSHEVEIFLEERARRIGRIVTEYVHEARAWELPARTTKGENEHVYSGLDALKAGGMASVQVIEGSGTPRTPEAMDAQLMDMYNAGLLGDPKNPDVADLVLGLLSSPIASRVLDAKEDAKQEALKRQVLEGQISDVMTLGAPSTVGVGTQPTSDASTPSVAATPPAQQSPSLNDFLGTGE